MAIGYGDEVVQPSITPVVNLIRAMLALRTAQQRELAIVGTAWLDAAIELNLRYNMRHFASAEPDKQVFSRALRGLESRLWVAEAFGLFGDREIRQQADLVRRVRNEFAHTIEDVSCDSPTIAPLIDQMTLTTDQVIIGLSMPSTEPETIRSWSFEFDGETFAGDSVAAIGDTEPDRLLFFVPKMTDTPSREDRLRRQIYATVFGVLGTGLRPWLEETGFGGVADLSGRPLRATEQGLEP